METLLLLAHRIVPESERFEPSEEAEFLGIIERALSTRPISVRRQLAFFVSFLRWLPLVRYGARLARLSTERQDAFLRWCEGAPLSILRKGFWGLKTLIFMGYYGRPNLGDRIAYRPSSAGNELLHVR